MGPRSWFLREDWGDFWGPRSSGPSPNKGIDEASESSEESEEEKPEEKEEEEEGKATPTPQEKKKKRGKTPPPQQELGETPQKTGFLTSSTPRKQRRVADVGGERHRQ